MAVVIKVEPSVWDQIDEIGKESVDGQGQSEAGTERVFLLGVPRSDDTVVVVTGAMRVAVADNELNWSSVVSDIVAMLPVGMACVGLCHLGGKGAESSVLDTVRKCVPSNTGCRKFCVLFVSASDATRQGKCLDVDSRALDELDAEVRTASDQAKTSCGYLRCKLDLPLQMIYRKKEERGKAIDRTIEDVTRNIKSNDFEFLYKLKKGGEEEEGYRTGFFSTSLAALSDERDMVGTLEEPLDLELYTSSSGAPPIAPVVRYEPASDAAFECETIDLHLNALVMLPREEDFTKVRGSVIEKLVAQLGAAKKMLVAYPNEKRFKYCHYSPNLLSYVVSIVYPDVGTDETKLFKRRQTLHRQLLLPLDRPLIRLSNAMSSGANSSFAKKLMDVHKVLKSSGVKDGKQSLVKGSYCYFHYMQDRFDDGGWGCAYRSLQTIISWFILNNYAIRKIPGHREIQQTLVNIGDKPATFVGSKQWIGAIEISFILDTMLDISSKVITFNSGAEIPTKAREIAHHFETQGTPIMIGGGVLAYTLLGIDYNESTGECAFLILDPHYTEGEDIDKICAGTWVGWKRLGDNAAAGGDLFVKTAFYNFLCPQRPNTV